MNTCLSRTAFLLLVCCVLGIAPVHAEVTVSITISGTIDEIIPVLEQLRGLGVGTSGATDDPLKLQVHSVMSSEEEEEEEVKTAPEEMTPKPRPTISQSTVEPAIAKPGDSVVVKATIGDPDRIIDTVAGTVASARVDLFDNGTGGDATAGDGIWSGTLTLPGNVETGANTITITAYNANGEQVTLPDAEGNLAPLTAEAALTVQD